MPPDERLFLSRMKRERAKARGMPWVKVCGDKHKPAAILLARHRNRLNLVVKKRHLWARGLVPHEILGCSSAEFVRHIEAQFQDGMSWDNRHDWELDHIRPCRDFDFLKQEHVAACFHFTNMRPLWRRENRARSRIAA